MKKNLIFGTLLSLSFSVQVFAQSVDCRLDTILTKKQLSSLKKGDDIKRVGLNKTLLGRDIYKIQILNNKKTNQPLVLLGEAHIKGFRSSLIGKSIVKQFTVRLVEGVPEAEMKAMAAADPEFYSGVTWKRNLLQYMLLNPFESTIYDAVKSGDNLEIAQLNAITKERDAHNEYTAKDLLDFKGLIQKTNSPTVNANMEFGDYLKPSSSDDYVLTARNIRMAKNISFISEAAASKGAQLVIVGSAHLPGLISLLKNKDFEVCESEF